MSLAVEFAGDVHPVADLFPMLADDELKELAEDIKANGLLQPVVLDGDGRLLDGRNRLAACRAAGVGPTFTVHDGDPEAYALSVNIARRHLTTGARAMIAAQASRLNGADQRKVAADTDLYQPRIAEASLVLDWSPDLAPNVIAGVTPLSTAVETARARKREAEALKAKMDRLRADAADLATLVDEERMGVDDAIAALDAREEEAEAEDRQARQERAEAVRRQVAWIGDFLRGWDCASHLRANPLRHEVLDAMSDHDRGRFLTIEEQLP